METHDCVDSLKKEIQQLRAALRLNIKPLSDAVVLQYATGGYVAGVPVPKGWKPTGEIRLAKVGEVVLELMDNAEPSAMEVLRVDGKAKARVILVRDGECKSQ